jgi:hypothetical protein
VRTSLEKKSDLPSDQGSDRNNYIKRTHIFVLFSFEGDKIKMGACKIEGGGGDTETHTKNLPLNSHSKHLL